MKHRSFILILPGLLLYAFGISDPPISPQREAPRPYAGIYLYQDSLGLVAEVLQLKKNGDYFFYSHTEFVGGDGSAGKWTVKGKTLYLTSFLTNDSIEASVEEHCDRPQSYLRVTGFNKNNDPAEFCEIHVWDGRSEVITLSPSITDTFYLPDDYPLAFIQVSDMRDYQSVWKPVHNPFCRDLSVTLAIPPIVSYCQHGYYKKFISEEFTIEGKDILWPMKEDRGLLRFQYVEEDDSRYRNLLQVLSEKNKLYE